MKNLRPWLIATAIILISVLSIQFVSAEILSKKEKKTFDRGMKFEKKNKPDAAMKEYEKILKKNPNASMALDRVAYLQMKGGDAKSAEETARRAIKSGGDCPVSYNIIGMMHERNGNLGYAEKYYLKSAEKDPDYAAPRNNMGNLFLKRGYADLALKQYKAAMEKDPDNPLYYNNAGYAMELCGNLVEAEEMYKKAESLGDKSGVAKKNLERIKFRNEKKTLSESDRKTLRSVCSAKMPLNFSVVEVLKDDANGNAAVWESTSDANQRFIIKTLPKDNAFTDTIFAQMVTEHKEELEKMLETLSGTTGLKITGQGYVLTPERQIMRIYADCMKDGIPLEGIFCMYSKVNPEKHSIILITANKGFLHRESADTFIKEAIKGL